MPPGPRAEVRQRKSGSKSLASGWKCRFVRSTRFARPHWQGRAVFFLEVFSRGCPTEFSGGDVLRMFPAWVSGLQEVSGFQEVSGPTEALRPQPPVCVSSRRPPPRGPRRAGRGKSSSCVMRGVLITGRECAEHTRAGPVCYSQLLRSPPAPADELSTLQERIGQVSCGIGP